ncbi:MAG: GGDEF domain-containing protein, partial [Acidobacteriota bacterium]|nr:GGDEF domain-containing protein [Acidobacteriota bacterium]
IDVDKFKSYNDDFGHTEGDKALKLVAECLKNTLRGADVAVRYGGEEFSILLPQTASDGALAIAERIREKVASTEFPNRQVTISVGVASCFNNICTEQEIVKWADNALYEAKRHGRNNVQVYEHINAEPMTGNAKLTDTKILQIEPLVFSENDFARIRLREKVDVEAIFLED